MKVIVAGLPKTGTKTMYAALHQLGFNVYDFMENFYFLGDDWIKTIREGAKIEDLKRMYKDVDAVTDGPSCFFWEEILGAFPDAKIVLTVRDEESWYKSATNQVSALSSDIKYISLLTFCFSGWRLFKFRTAAFSLFGCQEGWPWSAVRPYEEEALKRFFRNHNRNILQNAPKNQLLVYEVKQGWKPLCDFLDVEVPDREFPYKNKSSSVMDDLRREDEIMRRLVTELKVSLSVLLVLIGVALYTVFTSRWMYNLLGW